MNLLRAGHVDYVKSRIRLYLSSVYLQSLGFFSLHLEAKDSESSHIPCPRLPRASLKGFTPWCSKNHGASFPRHIGLPWCFHLNTKNCPSRSQIPRLISGGCSLTSVTTLVPGSWVMFAWHYWAPKSTRALDPVENALQRGGHGSGSVSLTDVQVLQVLDSTCRTSRLRCVFHSVGLMAI